MAGAALLVFWSVLDGVDGEIARARFETSTFGQHFDAIEGGAFYAAIAAGLGDGAGAQHRGDERRHLAAVSTVGILVWATGLPW